MISLKRTFQLIQLSLLSLSVTTPLPQPCDAAETKQKVQHYYNPKPSAATLTKALTTTPNLPYAFVPYFTNYRDNTCSWETRYLTPISSLHTWGEIKELDNKISDFPTDSQYYEERAKEEYVAGAALHALDDAKKAVEYNPFSASGHVVAALSYFQLKNRKLWLQEMKEVLTSVNSENLAEVEYAFAKMNGANIVDDPQDFIALGSLARGKTSKLVEQRIAVWMVDVLNRNIDGDIFACDWERAAKHLEMVNKVCRQAYVSRMQLGICYLRLNHVQQAETAFASACEIAPQERFCHLFRGYAFELLHNQTAAKREKAEAWRLASDWTRPYNSDQEKLSKTPQADFDHCFEFVETGKQLSEYGGMVDRKWYPDEKEVVRFMLSNALKRAPGLIFNAAAGQRIKLIARRAIRRNCDALFTAYSDTIACTDPNFVLSQSTYCKSLTLSDEQYSDYFHELSHLCSACGMLSASDEWLDAVHPIANKWLDSLQTEALEKKIISARDPISFGFPSYYATTNPEECFAEFAKNLIYPVSNKLDAFTPVPQVPPVDHLEPINQFLEAQLLNYPNAKLNKPTRAREIYDLDGDGLSTDGQIAYLQSCQKERPRSVKVIMDELSAFIDRGICPPNAESIIAEGLKRTSQSDFQTEQNYSSRIKLQAAWLYHRSNQADKAKTLLNDLLAVNTAKIPYDSYDCIIELAATLGDSKSVIKAFEKFGGLGYPEGFAKTSILEFAGALEKERGSEASISFLKRAAYKARFNRYSRTPEQDEQLPLYLAELAKTQKNPVFLDFIKRSAK